MKSGLIAPWLVVAMVTLPSLMWPGVAPHEAPAVAIVMDDRPGAPVRHGLDQLTRALERKGGAVRRIRNVDRASGAPVIVAGLSHGAGAAATLLRQRRISPPTAPESLLIERVPGRPPPLKDVWLVAAPDDRALMYALLDVADRIGWAADPLTPLSELRAAREAPAVAERALSIYTMHRTSFEAVVPPSDVTPHFDFMYFIEVMDNAGNGAIHPDLETDQPYIIVRLDRGGTDPSRGRHVVVPVR